MKIGYQRAQIGSKKMVVNIQELRMQAIKGQLSLKVRSKSLIIQHQ